MRIMAIDYGDAHTGVAISDPTGMLAGWTTTIDSRKQDVVVEQLRVIIAEWQVTELVLGYPKNMNDTKGERVLKSEGLAQRLTEETGLPVHLNLGRLPGLSPESEREGMRMLFDTDDNYVVLEMIGPDGKERRYELLDIVEFEGVAYGVFCPQEFPEDGDIILRLEGEDAQKPEGYVPVEDEGIAQAVYDIFHLKNMSSFDFQTYLEGE